MAYSRGGHMTVEHETAGPMTFETSVFTLQEEDEQRLILSSPQAEHGTPEKLAGLMAQRDADSP